MFPNYNNQQNQPWAPPQGQPNQPWSPPHGQPNQPYGSPHGQPNQPWSPPHDQPNQPWGSPNNQQFSQTSFSSQQTVQQSSYASRIENMHHQIYNQHIPSQPAPTDNNFRPTSAQHIPFGGSHSPQTNFGGHVPFQPYTQPISSPYGTPMNAFKQPTQSGNSNWLPSAKPASSKHIPFNLQRAHFNHDCGYIKADDLCKDLHDIKPDIKPAPEYKPEVRPEGKPEVKPEVKPVPHAEPENSKEDLLRISMITSVFTKNPYFHHQDYVPPAPEQINHVDKQKEEEEAEREKDRLKQKVFAFFTQAGSDFFEFTSLLGKLKMTGEKYVDKDFPADTNSLIGKNLMRKGEWGEVAWLRPDQFYGPGTYQIFQGNIEPNDIKQGQLGDCYFLSTLASLAEWPNRIQRIFGTKDVNTCGCYCVRVCEMGEWKEVVIDDFFPCDKFTKTPIFTTGNEKELWVLILEKVWAKIYGSYDAIEAGLTRECLHDFTGAPTKFFLTDRKEEYEMIWHKIIKAEKKQYCMTCGADDFFQQNQIVNTVNSKGIVSSHAYSLLAGYEVRDRNGRPVRLIKLRNPWGKTEWTGPWSDSSSEWTPQLKNELKLENKNDGIFFMAYEEFLKYFSDIQLCYIHDNHKYRCKRVTSSPRRAVYFKIRVTTPGKYYITVNQSSKRKNANNPHFMYSTVSIVTARMLPNQKYDYVTGNSRADREVWAKGVFEPGEYLVYAKVQWTSGRDSDFVLSTYGPGDTEIEVVKKQSYPGFLEQTFISKGKHSPKKMSYAREGEANCFSAVDISRDGFIFCYYQNNSSRTLETDIYFREFRGIKLRKPFRGREFKMVVPPGQEGIALLRILPNQDVKQVLSEKVRFVTATSSHGAGGYGGSTGATGGYGGSTGGAGGYSAGGSNPQVPNLDMEAKENGDMKRIKDSLTDEFVQVFIYQYRHDDGVYLYFENQTRDAVLEGKVICELRGLEPIGRTGAREIEFKIYPGSTHRIAFQKTSSSFDARFKYESRVVRV